MDKPSDSYFIGLDIGTSSAKAVAFGNRGEVIRESAVAYDLLQPEADAAVQDPETVRDASLQSLRTLLRQIGHPPRAIGLSSAMHSLLAVDQAGHPVSQLITWADGRAQPYAEKLKQSAAGKYIYQHGGTPMHAMAPVCKLAWLRDQRPDIFKRAVTFAGIKDYLLHHCFGKWVIDHSLASATGLFDLEQRAWMPEALAYAKIKAENLPNPVPVRTLLTGMRKETAEFLDLSPDIPWIIGASDGCLANLGAGVLGGQEAVLTIGTSGAIRMTITGPGYDPEERLFCYILDDAHYVIGGPTNNGGVVWEWFCEQFYPDQSMDEVFQQIAQISPGAEGLLFLPYLYGERAPVWDAFAKGHFWGIEPHHSRAHFGRAVLEGVCLNLYQIMQALEDIAGEITRIHANGGFTQSPVWIQLLADITGKEIVTGHNPNASAWGAAIMAMQAIGHPVPTGPTAKQRTFQPNQSAFQIYQSVYTAFKKIYPSAKVS